MLLGDRRRSEIAWRRRGGQATAPSYDEDIANPFRRPKFYTKN